MHKTLGGVIFQLSALKPENLGDLIALKQNFRKLLVVKFKVFSALSFNAKCAFRTRSSIYDGAFLRK